MNSNENDETNSKSSTEENQINETEKFESKENKEGIFELLKNRNFSLLWGGQIISNIGSYFSFIAILFLTISLTSGQNLGRQAQALALVTLIQVIPIFFLGPFAGVIVDRFDRKKIMIITDLIGILTATSMVFVTSMTQVYVLVSSFSLVRVFFFPAKGASIPKIVKPDQLTRANSLSSMSEQISRIAGPAISGFVIALFGIRFAFIIDGISFLISAILITFIFTDLKPPEQKDALTPKSALIDLKEGFKITFEDKSLRFVLITIFVIFMGFSMIDPLFAAYLTQRFGFGEEIFGLILSLSALTGFIAALTITIRGNIENKLYFIVIGLGIGAIAITILGFAPYLPFPIAFLCLGMALIGIVNVALMIPLSTLIQTIIKDENMGKVNSILGSIISFTQIGGAAIATALVIYLNISMVFIVVGGFGVFVILTSIVYMMTTNLNQVTKNKEEEMIKYKRELREQRKENAVNKSSIPSSTIMAD